MTDAIMPDTRTMSRIWPAVLRVSVAVAVSVIAVTWIGFTLNHLDQVYMTNERVAVGEAPSLGWAISNGLLALALALWVAPARPDRVGAVASGLAGAVIIAIGLSAMAELNGAFEFVDPSRECIRTGCWPRSEQGYLALAPALVAAVALALQSALPPRWRWWQRALIPVVVLVVTTIVQLVLWSDVILPYLRTDPAS